MSQDPTTTILNIVQQARDMDLGEALYSPEMVRAAKTTARSFSDDGHLTRLGAEGLPPQRLDWIVAPGAPAGVQVARYHVPSASGIRNISMIATGNVSGTFSVDVLVNAVRVTGGSIRVGTSQAKGALNVSVPAGSVVSIETKNSIAQGVTVSVFYRPTED